MASLPAPPPAGLAELRQTVHDCRACTARAEARLPVPPSFPFGGLEGYGRPRVIVVGRNPGRTEDEVNAPFMGAAGRKLNDWLSSAGLSREWDTIITNLVKCYTTDNRPPTKAEIDTCKGLHLVRELTIFKPQLVIGFGAQVRDALSSNTEFTSTVDHVPGRVATFYTYHPAAVLRGSAKIGNRFYRDAEVVRRWLDENPWDPT